MRLKHLFTLAAALLMLSVTAFAGKEVGNGGFAFTRAKTLLDWAKADITNDLSVFDKACFNRLIDLKRLKPVDLDVLRAVIQGTRSSYAKAKMRKPRRGGHAEPLMFDYGRDRNGPYIEALQLFFVAYMTISEDEQGGYLGDVKRMLYHEASHIFGNNENEAAHFAETLLRANVYQTKAEKEMELRTAHEASEENAEEHYYSCEELVGE